MGRYKNKTKKERQQWWADLTTEQQAIHLERWQAGKSIMRRSRSIEFMSKITILFSCKKCFHGQGRNCTDNLPNGCEYWFHPKSKKMGIAYKRTA
jgi:hypothetical protein